MTTTHTTRRAIFMVGGPAAGKSRIRKERFDGIPVLDCDAFKAAHPDYDPKNPAALHEWSAAKLVELFHQTLADGTDFVVTVCYVQVSLPTAIKRNAARERTVPESMLRSKHALVATSFELIAPHADDIQIVNNNCEIT